VRNSCIARFSVNLVDWCIMGMAGRATSSDNAALIATFLFITISIIAISTEAQKWLLRHQWRCTRHWQQQKQQM